MNKSQTLLAFAFTSIFSAAHAADLLTRDATNPNQGFYIRAGADYLRLRNSGTPTSNFAGGSFAGGLNFAESTVGYFQVELQAGALCSETTIAVKETDIAVPALLNCNYDFKLTQIVHPYIGATAGVTYFNASIRDLPLGKMTADGTTFTYGGGVGIYFRCTDSFGIDFGYRFLRMESFQADVTYGGSWSQAHVDAVNAHNVRIAAVYRF